MNRWISRCLSCAILVSALVMMPDLVNAGKQMLWVTNAYGDDVHVIDEIPFSNVVRPPALSKDEKRFYQHIDGLLGFEVADIKTRKVIAKVRHTIPKDLQAKGSRSHGLAIRPDQKEIWSCNVEHGIVHIHDSTTNDFPEITQIKMIDRVYWLCFTPDSKYAYISVRGANKVCVIDCKSKKIVTHIPVGDTPKRNLVLVLPDEVTGS